MKVIHTICIFSLLFCISCGFYSAKQCFAAKNESATEQGTATESKKTNQNPVDSILEKLNKSTQELKTYQCQIEYRYVQPVFATQSLWKGILYYSKQENKSKLRVNFQTLQQDEEQEQKNNKQYIVLDGSAMPKNGTKYEGIWLVDIDYEFKSPKYIQLAHAGEPNKPVDVFDLVSKKLPMVGFTKSDQLKEQFEITLPEQKNSEPGDIIQVHLKVKPNSVYKDVYVQIDCWIDQKLNLPVKIAAVSTEPDGVSPDQKEYCEIKFVNAKINEKIEPKIFDFQIPEGFDEPEIFH